MAATALSIPSPSKPVNIMAPAFPYISFLTILLGSTNILTFLIISLCGSNGSFHLSIPSPSKSVNIMASAFPYISFLTILFDNTNSLTSFTIKDFISDNCGSSFLLLTFPSKPITSWL